VSSLYKYTGWVRSIERSRRYLWSPPPNHELSSIVSSFFPLLVACLPRFRSFSPHSSYFFLVLSTPARALEILFLSLVPIEFGGFLVICCFSLPTSLPLFFPFSLCVSYGSSGPLSVPVPSPLSFPAAVSTFPFLK